MVAESVDHPRALKGTKVLDLTRFLSGPQSTLFLSALGAEVIRIDEPTTGDPAADAPPFFGPKGVSMQRRTAEDLGIAYLKRARGKKAVTLNLKSEEGRQLFLRLVKTADVLVENFRVGVTERLGIDYASLQKVNPRLIYCSITGYGATGADSRLKAFDLMVQAATGLMSITGEAAGQACKAGSPLSDGIAGTFAVIGVLGAILQRERTGTGQFIDVSMADCLMSLMFDEPLDCYGALGLPLRQGNRIMRFSPFNTYPTLDGAVTIGAATKNDWILLLEVMGRTDLLQSEQFMNTGWRISNNDKVDEVVSAWTGERKTLDVLSVLNSRDISCAPIRDMDAIASWPHLKDRNLLRPVPHPDTSIANGPLAPSFPLKMSETRTDYETPAAFHGQHNDEIYGAVLGLTVQDMEGLSERGII